MENDSFFASKNPNWLKFTVLWTIATPLALYAIHYLRLKGILVGWFLNIPKLPNTYLNIYLNYISGKSIAGLMIGFVQWLVLRQYVKDAYWWIIGTVIGYAVSAVTFLPTVNNAVLSWTVDDTIFKSILDILFGEPSLVSSIPGSMQGQILYYLATTFLAAIVIGFFQWVSLLRWFEKMGYWLLLVLAGELTNEVFVFYTSFDFYVSKALGWLAFAMITGVGLAYLLRLNWKKEMHVAT